MLFYLLIVTDLYGNFEFQFKLDIFHDYIMVPLSMFILIGIYQMFTCKDISRTWGINSTFPSHLINLRNIHNNPIKIKLQINQMHSTKNKAFELIWIHDNDTFCIEFLERKRFDTIIKEYLKDVFEFTLLGQKMILDPIDINYL